MAAEPAEGPDCTFLPGQLVCHMERSSSPTSSGAPSRPEKEKTTLANVICRTYSGEHPARDCIAGPIRESSHDHRWDASLLSRRGSGRLLLPHVLRAGSILLAGQ